MEKKPYSPPTITDALSEAHAIFMAMGAPPKRGVHRLPFLDATGRMIGVAITEDGRAIGWATFTPADQASNIEKLWQMLDAADAMPPSLKVG